MNYYGTNKWGHDLAFHSGGLPFVLSINDVPEAWKLYGRAGSITRLCSGKNGSKPAAGSGNPVCGAGMAEAILRIEAAILCPTQGPRQARTRSAPGPRQARARPAPGPQSDFGGERGRISDFGGEKFGSTGLAFPSLLRTFRPQRER